MQDTADSKPPVIGWREWASLPELDIPAIKVKVDTGAKTSALHAFQLETWHADGEQEYVRFWLHPLRRRDDIVICCEAPILDRRVVKDSSGNAEERCVIQTPIRIGTHQWDIELTLTSREDMLFRMLLGRRAMVDSGFVVDPSASYLAGKKPRKAYPLRPRKKKETAQ